VRLPLCFSRKNRTLGAIFGQKKVLEVLEKNYKTLEALGQLKNDVEPTNMSTLADKTDDQWAFPNQNDDQGMDVEDGKAEEDGMEVEGSDADSDDDANENDSGFKAKVIGVLKQYDYADKRSSKLTQNEFIHLLSVYNQAGIHFTSSK